MTTQHLSPLTMLLSRHTRRREFITLLGGAVAWPLAAHAQQPAMPVIGFLSSGQPQVFARMIDAFRQGLNEMGYVVGQNVAFEHRAAGSEYDRFRASASRARGREYKIPGAEAALADQPLRSCAQPADLADRPQRRAADLAHALGDRIRGGEDLVTLLVQ